ncbi:MAG: SAM-dependent chlorinase/fluorinase [Anaerolineae bacterium]|nr:SAM-dependent chlorinase/fluorinase [Anaerolineae bacterium]MDQ7035141.1 SAM-dependent chlorinase/fluorinase [Anaerolineae bacterium]
MAKLIALLTDFGNNDIYVGVMKAVMKSITPDAEFIDIAHTITPQAVQEGAIALKNSFHYFPQGTVFLVVVDPGVGSARRPIIVEADGYCFIAPDNGILTYTLANMTHIHAYELANSDYQLTQISNTFHGRDIFAPAAAYAARGDVKLQSFGAKIEQLQSLPQPKLIVRENVITGEVIHIDHFGNIITSITPLEWVDSEMLLLADEKTILAQNTMIQIGKTSIQGISQAYHEVGIGDLLIQVDSNGALEIAANQGNAAKKLAIELGNKIELRL